MSQYTMRPTAMSSSQPTMLSCSSRKRSRDSRWDDTELLDYDEDSGLDYMVSCCTPDLSAIFTTQQADSSETGPSAIITTQQADSSCTGLFAIVVAQQADGSWLLSSELAKFVGKTLEEVKSGCPTECEGVVGGVWATLLMLELLCSQFGNNQKEWELVGCKAESWIKKQSLPRGASLDQLKSAARKFLA